MARLMLFSTKTRVLEAAREAGFSVAYFDRSDHIDNERRALADVTQGFDGSPGDALRLATRLHAESPFDAVIGFNEFNLIPASLIRDAMGLIGNPLRPAFLSKHKPLLRRALRAYSDLSVRYGTIAERPERLDEAADNLCASVGLPMILKPSDGAGSRSVRLCHTAKEVLAYLEQCSFSSALIAEEYLEGPEYSVEGFSAFGQHQVLTVTSKATTGAPHFIEVGHTQPAEISDRDRSSIAQFTSRIMTAIGHDIGPTHTEIKLTSAGPRLIETHTRPGGDSITDLVALTTGIDVYRETLRILNSICDLGYDAAKARYAPLEASAALHASSQFFFGAAGLVKNVVGVEEAKADSALVEIAGLPAKGQILEVPTESAKRHGHFIVKAETAVDLESAIQRIRSSVKIEQGDGRGSEM